MACLNEKGPTLRGEKVNRYSGHLQELLQSLKTDPKSRGQEMERRLRDSHDFEGRNDYAVALVLLGRDPEAISLLEAMEKERPGEYATAGNLGTAYELAGKNELALHWIREGMRRNADSHEGTEWVHVKILEAKIEQEKQPDYFKTHSVLNLDPNRIQDASSVVTFENKPFSSQDVRTAIHYQLAERLQFVKKTDPSVASLLFDYAALEAATTTVENLRLILDLAVKFGYPTDKVLPLYKQIDHVMRLTKVKKIAWYAVIGFCVVGFLVYSVKKRWIRLA